VTSTLRARARTATLVLGATASLGLVACGDDDGGGGSKKDYQSSLNTFCGNLITKQKSLQTDVQEAAGGAGTNPGKAAKALADVLAEYGTTLKSELATLDKTDVPGDYKSFDDQLSKGITQVSQIATSTAGKLEKIDLSGVSKGDTSGLTALQTALTDLAKQSNPLKDLKAPKDLQDNAPKCDQLSQS
jgi:hypothetical protein